MTKKRLPYKDLLREREREKELFVGREEEREVSKRERLLLMGCGSVGGVIAGGLPAPTRPLLCWPRKSANSALLKAAR